ncbi:NUDIX hydrolase [Bacillus kwashiorkori]|uniref:NUDIX hydrolase n=1 Tax=Bacillus kwashiorkori TaxID=1522318 RepID=UPI0007839826|nr:CoA pyrophosphatase [Bacillus kwashiorkori]
MVIQNIIDKVKNHSPKMLDSDQFRAYAILIPLISIDNETHILFEVRSKQLRNQPGEICFPGGRIDTDDLDAKAAAIRETSEEIGIDSIDIQQVFPLDYLIQPIEGRTIYPFIGLIKENIQLNPNHDEVEELFTVPLAHFLQQKPEKHTLRFNIVPDQNFPFHLIQGGENYPWKTRSIIEYFYFYKQYCIWGLTAKILNHFTTIIENDPK